MDGTDGEQDSSMPTREWSEAQRSLRKSVLYWFWMKYLTIVVQTCVLSQLRDSLFHDLPYYHHLFRIGVDAFDIDEERRNAAFEAIDEICPC